VSIATLNVAIVGGMIVFGQEQMADAKHLHNDDESRGPKFALSISSPRLAMADDSPLSFVLPPIQDNPDGSWGPSVLHMPAQFKE
jgi:hypothetical protein